MPSLSYQHHRVTRSPTRRERSSTDSDTSSSTETIRMTADAWARNFWITLMDEEGETFYANPATGERKWCLPAGTLVLPRSVEGEWYELWSDEHKLPYYFHTLTNETKWYKPDGFVIPLKAVQRFSKGKRFSILSLDSVHLPPNAPSYEHPPTSSDDSTTSSATFPDMSASDSFEDLAKRSLELDAEADPLAAALLQCMVNSTFSTNSTSLNSSRNGKDSRKSPARKELSSGSTSHFGSSEDSRSTIEGTKMDISSLDNEDRYLGDISLSSNSSLDSEASTPLQTPILPSSESFDSPYSPAAVARASVIRRDEDFDSSLLLSPNNSPYAGIYADENEDLHHEGTHSSACSPKAKLVSPLKVRKKRSKIGLGEAFEPVVPVPASPRSPGNEAHSVRSPSSRFSSMFGSPKVPTSPRREDSHSTPKGIVSPKSTWGRSTFGKATSPVISSPRQQAPFTTESDALPSSPISADPVSASSTLSNITNNQPTRSAQLPGPLLSDIQRFSLDNYAAQHFGQRRKTGLFRRQISIQDSMKWQAGDPEGPFLNLPKALRWDALQCFTHLQHVMGDRVRSDSLIRVSLEDINAPSSWDTSTTSEARKILSCGIESSSSSTSVSDLRDEIFVQLICQLSENPSAISIYRGWQFMQVLLITFPPSPSLEPTLRQFIQARKNSGPKSRLGIIARFALMKLDQIIVKGPRGKVPSHFEIKAASEGAFQPSVFGETLQRIMSLQSEAYPEAKIPIILPFLADGIMALGGPRTPGIFRTPGDVEKVNELKILIDQGRYSFTGYEDPHIAASLFKLWLRELLQPLIPLEMYEECMSAAEDEKRVIEIVQKLPSLNRRIVAFVVSFLQIFTQEQVVTKTSMTVDALSMIFTPALFRPPPVGAGSISTVFNNARVEQRFLLQLLTNLDVSTLQDEDAWIPTHSTNFSISSSNFSSSVSSSDQSYEAKSTDTSDSRPSLDSTASSALSMSTSSIASTKRKNRPRMRARTKTEVMDTSQQYAGDVSSSGSSTDAATSPETARSRSVSDSVYLRGGKASREAPPPLPVFVIDEAD